MGKDKLKKFAKYKSFPFCYENLSYDQPQLLDSQNQAVDLPESGNQILVLLVAI